MKNFLMPLLKFIPCTLLPPKLACVIKDPKKQANQGDVKRNTNVTKGKTNLIAPILFALLVGSYRTENGPP